jgi:hypothetical protein
MNFLTVIEDKWQAFCKNTAPAREKFADTCRKIGKTLKTIWSYIYRLRVAILAVPVAVGAVYLAVTNMAKLPDSVGINLLENGEFSMMVPKLVAVLGPLGVTALSIILMIGARKTLYPWLISLFTLVLPILIYVTNVYPA